MKTVILQALIMYGMAAIISMFVATLIRGLYVAVKRLTEKKN